MQTVEAERVDMSGTVTVRWLAVGGNVRSTTGCRAGLRGYHHVLYRKNKGAGLGGTRNPIPGMNYPATYCKCNTDVQLQQHVVQNILGNVTKLMSERDREVAQSPSASLFGTPVRLRQL